jgi:hypothetical protein
MRIGIQPVNCNTDPDPAFQNNADPKPSITARLAPDSDLKYCLNVCIVEVYILGYMVIVVEDPK